MICVNGVCCLGMSIVCAASMRLCASSTESVGAWSSHLFDCVVGGFSIKLVLMAIPLRLIGCLLCENDSMRLFAQQLVSSLKRIVVLSEALSYVVERCYSLTGHHKK